jgi:hypothetical protein
MKTTTKKSTAKLTAEDLLRAVKEHATAHYEEDGWDFLVECHSDAEIMQAIGKATTVPAAIRNAKQNLGLVEQAQQRAEVLATADKQPAADPSPEPATEPAPVETPPADVEVVGELVSRVLRVRVNGREHWPDERELRGLVVHEDGRVTFKIPGRIAKRWGVIPKAA